MIPSSTPLGRSLSIPRSVAWLGLALAFAAMPACDLAEPDSGEFQLREAEAANLPAGDAVEAQAACSTRLNSIRAGRELVIRSTAIVDDPVRTQWNGNPNANASGVWHFGRLMTQMAGDRDPSQFVLTWLQQWAQDRTINQQTVPARPGIQDIIDDWPKTGSGALDLTQAPFRLLAIVNRVDLAGNVDAGEGRFVFGLVGPGGSAPPFTIILEYDLPLSVMSQRQWTEAWHELSSSSPGSSAYKQQLQQLTQSFAGAGVQPGRPNGSAVSQVRTNEITLGFPWELREFKLNGNGRLRGRPVALTPRNGLDGSNRLGRFINQNEDLILAGQHGVPNVFEGARLRGGRVLNRIDFWSAPNINDNEARHLFSLNTCNGCHGAETGTNDFLHIHPRAAGSVAVLSGFMTGSQVTDPVDGTVRTFNDILRRRKNVRRILCE